MHDEPSRNRRAFVAHSSRIRRARTSETNRRAFVAAASSLRPVDRLISANPLKSLLRRFRNRSGTECEKTQRFQRAQVRRFPPSNEGIFTVATGVGSPHRNPAWQRGFLRMLQLPEPRTVAATVALTVAATVAMRTVALPEPMSADDVYGEVGA